MNRTEIIVFICLLPSLLLGDNIRSKGATRIVGQEPAVRPQFSRIPSIEAVVKLLEACPAWAETTEDELDDRESILKHISAIFAYDLEIIRAAMKQYIELHPPASPNYVAHASKLFVLNRYIFNAPSKAPFNHAPFGGWHGVPVTSNEIDWLWPLSVDSDGNILLPGALKGYAGPPYQALEEFDYFRTRFGPRRSTNKPEK